MQVAEAAGTLKNTLSVRRLGNAVKLQVLENANFREPGGSDHLAKVLESMRGGWMADVRCLSEMKQHMSIYVHIYIDLKGIVEAEKHLEARAKPGGDNMEEVPGRGASAEPGAVGDAVTARGGVADIEEEVADEVGGGRGEGG